MAEVKLAQKPQHGWIQAVQRRRSYDSDRCRLVLCAGVLIASGCGSGAASAPSPGVPTINAITPTSAFAGSPDLPLTVTGSNFAGTVGIHSRVVWSANGSDIHLPTTFVSSMQLTAVIPAALLSNPVSAQVSLETGDMLGDGPLTKSNSINFSVVTPPPGAPSISSISPTSGTAGSPDLTVTITGSNFVGTSHNVRHFIWSTNGTSTRLGTTAVSSTQITAVIPAALLSSVVTAQVFIEFGDPMGDVPLSKSNSVTFSVTAADAATASVSPTLATLGPTGTQQFVAIMNLNKADATWEVEEGAAGGSITSSGLYTVPARVGTFHVIATFVVDPSKNAVATISAVSSGFTSTGSMNKARSGHTATLLANGEVLIVGGGSADLDASAELFDPTTGTFASTGSMTTTRAGATATLLANGKVLITGGFGPGEGMLPRLSSAELYDPQAGVFAVTGSMSVGRVRHTATLLNDGKVLITGGTDASGGGGAATASAELYDPSSGTFTPIGSMASERADHTATLLASGEVLIVGGWNGHAADAADDPPWDPLFAELFDPSSGSFTSSGSMSTTRNGHSAIRFADGKVLVFGGVPSFQNIHVQLSDPQYAELYDPATGTFSSAGSFEMSRTGYTATLLTDGMVLIVGGEQTGIAVASAERLDPATGISSATGGLVVEREGHSATRLIDGRVLVTGGIDSKGTVLATAELYE